MMRRKGGCNVPLPTDSRSREWETWALIRFIELIRARRSTGSVVGRESRISSIDFAVTRALLERGL